MHVSTSVSCSAAYLEQHAVRVVLPVRGEEGLLQEGVEGLGAALLQQSQQCARVSHRVVEALAVELRLVEHAEQRLRAIS